MRGDEETHRPSGSMVHGIRKENMSPGKVTEREAVSSG